MTRDEIDIYQLDIVLTRTDDRIGAGDAAWAGHTAPEGDRVYVHVERWDDVRTHWCVRLSGAGEESESYWQSSPEDAYEYACERASKVAPRLLREILVHEWAVERRRREERDRREEEGEPWL